MCCVFSFTETVWRLFFPRLCTFFRKWKCNLQIKDNAPQLTVSPQNVSRLSFPVFSFFTLLFQNDEVGLFFPRDKWHFQSREIYGCYPTQICEESYLRLEQSSHRAEKLGVINRLFVIPNIVKQPWKMQNRETRPSCLTWMNALQPSRAHERPIQTLFSRSTNNPEILFHHGARAPRVPLASRISKDKCSSPTPIRDCGQTALIWWLNQSPEPRGRNIYERQHRSWWNGNVSSKAVALRPLGDIRWVFVSVGHLTHSALMYTVRTSFVTYTGQCTVGFFFGCRNIWARDRAEPRGQASGRLCCEVVKRVRRGAVRAQVRCCQTVHVTQISAGTPLYSPNAAIRRQRRGSEGTVDEREQQTSESCFNPHIEWFLWRLWCK